MTSLNRVIAEERIAYVVDTAVGAQGMNDGIKTHLADIRKAVGLSSPVPASGTNEFLKRFGKGI